MAGLISNGTYAFALADGKIPNDLIVNTTHTLETASFTGDWSALAEATYTNPGYTPINVTTYQTGSQYQQRWQTASITYQKNAVYISGYMCKVTAGVANSVKVTITWVKDEAYVNSLLPGNIKDETVLWEGTLGSVSNVANLSESLENFETVKFYCCDKNNNCTNVIEVCRTKNNNFAVANFDIVVEFVLNSNGNLYERHACLLPNSERTTLTATMGYELVFTAAKATTYNPISSGDLPCVLTKVVGIKRKVA